MTVWRRIFLTLCGAIFMGLLAPSLLLATPENERVASIDYCADQFVLALVPRHQITALSRDATSVNSFFRDQAKGLPQTRGSMEELLALSPTLMVRQWQGSPAMDKILNRAGIKTVALPFALTTDDALNSMISFGSRIDRKADAERFVAKRHAMAATLTEALPLPLKVLYLTPSGYTAGLGTGVDAIIKRAGLETMAETFGRKGWGPIPMEALVRDQPDVIVTSFFDLPRAPSNWSLSGHPRVADMLEGLPVIDLPGRYMACSTLFAIDAATYIRTEATRLGLDN